MHAQTAYTGNVWEAVQRRLSIRALLSWQKFMNTNNARAEIKHVNVASRVTFGKWFKDGNL